MTRPGRTLSGLALLLTLGWSASLWLPAVLVYAPSASLPKGWYVRAFPGRALQVGDLVVLEVPASMAASVPLDVPHRRLLKHVAALGGDTVCWAQDAMVVRTLQGTARYPFHPDGPMGTHPNGCHTLETESVVIIGTHPRSFDSRYVGAVPVSLVRFRVWPLWTWRMA
jgi:type IV secretory pathway protease TraF